MNMTKRETIVFWYGVTLTIFLFDALDWHRDEEGFDFVAAFFFVSIAVSMFFYLRKDDSKSDHGTEL